MLLQRFITALILTLCVAAAPVEEPDFDSDLGVVNNKSITERDDGLFPRIVNDGKRASIQIAVFSKPFCRGQAVLHSSIRYGTNYPAPMRSYRLSRDLKGAEQLDFSHAVNEKMKRRVTPKGCARFHMSAGGVLREKGCHSLALGIS
ncbi:MAG: hypothetical protein LQ351_007354 [Letrouitia transgressa]|nr:MAG: hypothetical protein LQ351_007354 [Letrouitia transgressa]